VANNIIGSGPNPDLTLRLEVSPHLELIGSAEVRLPVPELREATAAFRVRARGRLGSGSLTQGIISFHTNSRP